MPSDTLSRLSRETGEPQRWEGDVAIVAGPIDSGLVEYEGHVQPDENGRYLGTLDWTWTTELGFRPFANRIHGVDRLVRKPNAELPSLGSADEQWSCACAAVRARYAPDLVRLVQDRAAEPTSTPDAAETRT